MKCTWVDCENEATVPQTAKDGREWANLCASHDAQITKDIVEGNARGILRDWVKASGGHKKMAARMVGE